MPTVTETLRARSARPALRTRLLGLGGAVAAPLAIFFLVSTVPGWEFWAPAGGGQPAHQIGAGNIVLAASVASLSAWTLLVILERLTLRAARAWLVAAAGALLLSLVSPLTGPGIAAAQRALLVALHCAVAAVLIPVMYHSAGQRSDPHADG